MLDSVAVTVMRPPFSSMLVDESASVAAGLSSSTMIRVTSAGAVMLPLATVAETVTVSSVLSASCRAVIVTVPVEVVAPAAKRSVLLVDRL